jgi:hypothetical protein
LILKKKYSLINHISNYTHHRADSHQHESIIFIFFLDRGKPRDQ